ncbi:MAG TPA: hypothetical protein PLF40_02320 [Kofleriaceae bacterium]|nr:hypothetical protein [Kofleriaceae bacterium]
MNFSRLAVGSLLLFACGSTPTKSPDAAAARDAPIDSVTTPIDARPSDAATANLDPVGKWETTAVLTGCPFSSLPVDTTVAKQGALYVTNYSPSPGFVVTLQNGSVTCTTVLCTLNNDVEGAITDIPSTLNYTLQLQPSGAITGTGTLSFAGQQCPMTFTGTKRPA